jgi:proteasome-associated ATPase
MEKSFKDRDRKWVGPKRDKEVSPYLPTSEAAMNEKLSKYEHLLDDLLGQVQYFENESTGLSDRLERLRSDFDDLKHTNQDITGQLSDARKQNEKLVMAFQEAKHQIEQLREEVDKLSAPPNSYGKFIAHNPDGTVDVDLDGRRVRVNVHPRLDAESFEPGQSLILNESLNVVAATEFETKGDVMMVKDFLDEDRIVVVGRADEERVFQLSEPLRVEPPQVADHVMVDPRSGFALEKIPKSQVEEVVLEEVPDITYDHIGGLAKQIEALRDAIELPYLHPEEFATFQLAPPKGILLYGPPGCGKTMIAKAIAHSLATEMSRRTGQETKGYFLNVKGPELLNKYVGETEFKIREVFKKAKTKASEVCPVIIFFDEMDALFRMRGSGISSDVETTVVAQFLSEIDGVEALRNVIIIGASNRQDLIDPAILRPGRLDLKIKVDRPDEEAAREIFSKYLLPTLPIHSEELSPVGGDPEACVARLIDATVEAMYEATEDNRFLEVTYAKGEKEIFYFKDFASGAMIENIVRRAKKLALKRSIAGQERGIRASDLLESVREEFKENEDLPNTTNPDDWARIAGRKGERIVNVRTLLRGHVPPRSDIEDVIARQYM